MAICNLYSYLRPKDDITCQSMCHLSICLSCLSWPSAIRVRTYIPTTDTTCLSSVNLSVIIYCQLWPFAILIRTYFPTMDIVFLSMFHLSVCLSRPSTIRICNCVPTMDITCLSSVSFCLTVMTICNLNPHLRPHDGRLPFVRVVYFVDHLFQIRLQSRKQRWN